MKKNQLLLLFDYKILNRRKYYKIILAHENSFFQHLHPPFFFFKSVIYVSPYWFSPSFKVSVLIFYYANDSLWSSIFYAIFANISWTPVLSLALHSWEILILCAAANVYNSCKLTYCLSYMSLLFPANAIIQFPGALS